MLIDISDLEKSSVSADVVIIGSGIAGMYLAQQLARQGASVLVIESGQVDYNENIDQLNSLHFSGKRHRKYTQGTWFHSYLPEHLRGKNRVRQYGGRA